MKQNKKEAELQILQQIEQLEAWRNVKGIDVHQTGDPPYYVWRGQGGFSGIVPEFPVDYSRTTPDELGFPMLPEDFERLLPALKSAGVSVMVWGGEVERIPRKHLLSIPDMRVLFAEGGD